MKLSSEYINRFNNFKDEFILLKQANSYVCFIFKKITNKYDDKEY